MSLPLGLGLGRRESGKGLACLVALPGHLEIDACSQRSLGTPLPPRENLSHSHGPRPPSVAVSVPREGPLHSSFL